MAHVPKVYNKHHKDAPADAVYIGRGSLYGNPFIIGEHGTREQVIKMFEEKLLGNPEAMALVRKDLRGKDLVCYCAPKACHGDVLLRVANQPACAGLGALKLGAPKEHARAKPLNAKTLAALPIGVATLNAEIEYLEGAIKSTPNPRLNQHFVEKKEALVRVAEWLHSKHAAEAHNPEPED